jgi:hypothetical protein
MGQRHLSPAAISSKWTPYIGRSNSLGGSSSLPAGGFPSMSIDDAEDIITNPQRHATFELYDAALTILQSTPVRASLFALAEVTRRNLKPVVEGNQ